MTIQQPPVPPFVDNADLSETFADSVRSVHFDGGTWRIEFAVNRIQADQIKPSAPPPAKQFPTCRLVLTAPAGVDLMNKLSQIASILEQQGVLKKDQPPPVLAPDAKKH